MKRILSQFDELKLYFQIVKDEGSRNLFLFIH